MAYQQFFSQYPQYYQNNQGLTWVQGEAGAKSYLVAPNNTVPLWDTEKQTVYIKSCDASGMPSMKILDYTVRDNTPQNTPITSKTDFATKDDINTLKEELEALKGKLGGLLDE